MKLKCVGGKCDGMIVDVEHARYRKNDAVRVPLPIIPVKVTENFFSVNDSIPETITINFSIYVIDVLHFHTPEGGNAGFNKSDVWFLRPHNFNTFDAIQFQFNKV